MFEFLSSLLDAGGTFVFAISGAVAAVRRRMDIFGVMVLAFAAGNTGGMTRDVLIGAVPPAALSSWVYGSVSLAAGLIVFFEYHLVTRLDHPVQWFDALGLAFFAVAGTEKALRYGLDPVMAALLGMVTGIGGGILRDILANEIPVVLRSELYALAALAGAGIFSAGHVLEQDPVGSAVLAMAVCFALRFMAIRYGWRLPAARPASNAEQKAARDKIDDGRS